MNERTILIVDCGSGIAIALLGALATTGELLGRTWWLVIAATVFFAVATYIDEQSLTTADMSRRLQFYLSTAGITLGGFALVVVTTGLGVSVVTVVAITGFGLATLGNRLVYGVVYPIPQGRLTRADRYGM